MKIIQLLSGITIPLSNKEKEFVERYSRVSLENLSEDDKWLAQNLIRRGIYEISKDNLTIIRKSHET